MGQGFLAGDSLILPKVNQVHLVVVTLHIGSHPLLPHKQCHSGGRIFSSDVLALLCSTTLGLNRKHSCFYLLAYYIVELNHHVFQWDPFGLWIPTSDNPSTLTLSIHFVMPLVFVLQS